jgi:hypothetical protein
VNLQILGIYRHVDVQNNFTKTLKLFFFLISLLWAIFFSMRLTTGTTPIIHERHEMIMRDMRWDLLFVFISWPISLLWAIFFSMRLSPQVPCMFT